MNLNHFEFIIEILLLYNQSTLLSMITGIQLFLLLDIDGTIFLDLFADTTISGLDFNKNALMTAYRPLHRDNML